MRGAACVAVVDLGDAREVFLLEAEALLIDVAQAGEQPREGEFDALRLAVIPGCGAEVVATGRRIDGLHLLNAEDEGRVIAAGLDLGGAHQHRDAARSAGRLVAGGRHSREAGIQLSEEAAQVALVAVELRREITDVRDFDLGRVARNGVQGAAHRLAEGVGEVLALLVPVAGEVGLVAAEDVDGCAHRGLLHSTRWYSNTRCHWVPREPSAAGRGECNGRRRYPPAWELPSSTTRQPRPPATPPKQGVHRC